MVGPDFYSPLPPAVNGYTETPLPKKTASTEIHGGESQQYQYGESVENMVCSKKFCWGRDLAAEWWLLFHSKPLNELINRGLMYNPNVLAAQAALRVAQENYWAGVGALFPAVSFQANASRQRVPFNAASTNGVGSTTSGITPGVPDIVSGGTSSSATSATTPGSITTSSSTFSLYNTSVNVSYVLDIFGGIRRNIESLCALVDYQRFILEGTYLTLAANIATTAISEASLRAQIESTNELIKLQRQLLKITNNQFILGAVSKSEVLGQEAQLAQTEASLPPLQKSLANARHALAALVGEFPSDSCIPRFSLESLNLPKHLPVSLPSRLVRQRPDIRAKEALMHQASALIGVATANMLPQITLTGSYGYIGTELSELFKPANVIWSYGAQLVQPIFQGGTLSARRCAAIATFEQTTELYRATVLQAFQNVADSLRAIETDARLLRMQRAAEKAASESLNLTTQQLKFGAVDYTFLLNAQRQYHLALIARIRAQELRYSDTVALFQALGGGWWNCDE